MLNPIDRLVHDIEQANNKHNSNMKDVLVKADEHLQSNLPDSGARSEFTTGAVRDASEGKGNPSLIPVDALRAVARRFEDGATKYGRDNWKQGIPLSRYVDSLYRHLWQFMEGDETEDHAGAIIWNAMCLTQTKKWVDEGKLPSELNDL
jgi:TPP-dependent pyruvate/acetoin dehydrogenase alpha subunit